MKPDRPKDAVLDTELERALSPYRQLLPPEMLEVFRGKLEQALTTHPVGSRLLRQNQPSPVVHDSDELERQPDGSRAKPDEPKAGSGTEGKP